MIDGDIQTALPFDGDLTDSDRIASALGDLAGAASDLIPLVEMTGNGLDAVRAAILAGFQVTAEAIYATAGQQVDLTERIDRVFVRHLTVQVPEHPEGGRHG